MKKWFPHGLKRHRLLLFFGYSAFTGAFLNAHNHKRVAQHFQLADIVFT